jgi:protease-4
MSVNRPLTAGERFIIQSGVNRTYDTFISRVADGRKKSKAYINSIGGGHVWVGTDAVKNGLADRIGNFNDAIVAAGKKAKLKDYKVAEYPEKTDAFKELLNDASDNIKTHFAKQELGENFQLYQQMKKVLIHSGLQARMPFEIKVQ